MATPKVHSSASLPVGNAVSLAHEINNPLAALANLLHLAEAETSTERGRHFLKLAEEEIQRMSQLTNSTLEQSRKTAIVDDINIPELVSSVLDLYSSRFESGHIEVSSRFSVNGNVCGDAGALHRMISNLLLNSADAMPYGGKVYARVSPGHEWVGQERGGVRLTIADNGCGIRSDYLPRVLEPFFTTKGKPGTGIGLSVVKDTVQKHRGRLRVRSCTTPGKSGTVFSIFLPSS